MNNFTAYEFAAYEFCAYNFMNDPAKYWNLYTSFSHYKHKGIISVCFVFDKNSNIYFLHFLKEDPDDQEIKSRTTFIEYLDTAEYWALGLSKFIERCTICDFYQS